MPSVRVSVAVWSAVSAGAGYLLGQRKDELLSHSAWDRLASAFARKNDENTTLFSFTNHVEKTPVEEVPAWYQYLPVPFQVSASSAPLERSNLPSPVTASAVPTPTNRVGEIMKFGYPNLDNVRFYEDYVVSYDRRNRTAHWVFEHIRSQNCDKTEGIERAKSSFKEDDSVHPYFRATNADYKGSGFDRGHLAAASNHRHSQKAMDQTFILSNVSPQVGEGFNRGVWNNLEKYTRAIARKSRSVYVCTGPLYLPRIEPDGKKYVKYQVIGPSQVSVPTHFFKVLVIEDQQGQFEMKAYVMPNQRLPDDVKLTAYLYPIDAIERAAGFLLFDKIPRRAFKLINGDRPK